MGDLPDDVNKVCTTPEGEVKVKLDPDLPALSRHLTALVVIGVCPHCHEVDERRLFERLGDR